MPGLIASFANNKDIVIFGSSFCKYCRRSKELLEGLKHPSWIYINLEEQDPTLEQYLKLETGQKTIPLIYVKQKPIDYSIELENKTDLKTNYQFLGGYTQLENSIWPKIE